MTQRCFGITVTSRMRHAALLRAARACGSAAALAKRLGVYGSTIGSWINLVAVPAFCKGRIAITDRQKAQVARWWPSERVSALEKTLFELTGQTIDELFPPELCANEAFLNAHKQIEQTRDISTVRLSHVADQRLLLPSPAEVVADADLAEYQKKQINKALKTLCCREREIIELHYGLNGHESHTFKEIGHALGVTGTAIHLAESRAMKKLQKSNRTKELVNTLDE